jgi:hypothetical protein
MHAETFCFSTRHAMDQHLLELSAPVETAVDEPAHEIDGAHL